MYKKWKKYSLKKLMSFYLFDMQVDIDIMIRLRLSLATKCYAVVIRSIVWRYLFVKNGVYCTIQSSVSHLHVTRTDNLYLISRYSWHVAVTLILISFMTHLKDRYYSGRYVQISIRLFLRQCSRNSSSVIN